MLTEEEMPSKFLFRVAVLLLFLAQASGCSRSASGTFFKNAEPEGEEYELIGVVNGLWKYDVSENLSRLEKLLPEGEIVELDQASKLYQVRVGFTRSMFNASASEVVILPDGWSYTTDSQVTGDKVVNIGDLVAVRAKKHRRVDYFTKIVRKCNEAPSEDERPEWDIGCQAVAEFGDNGYGGERYFWTAF